VKQRRITIDVADNDHLTSGERSGLPWLAERRRLCASIEN
jgi:hypothetical protein